MRGLKDKKELGGATVRPQVRDVEEGGRGGVCPEPGCGAQCPPKGGHCLAGAARPELGDTWLNWDPTAAAQLPVRVSYYTSLSQGWVRFKTQIRYCFVLVKMKMIKFAHHTSGTICVWK